MSINTLAGKPAPQELLIDIQALLEAYYINKPNPENPAQCVSFGTSGHRGSSFDSSFNEDHILAITQAVCEYRKTQGIIGPLYMGMDSHALSVPAHRSAIEVLAANEVYTFVHAGEKVTPTPVISYSILCYNKQNKNQQADGIVITPSHNPPRDGGFKYNPPHGGPADKDITDWIQNRANELLRNKCAGIRRLPYTEALKSGFVKDYDYVTPYVNDLEKVVNMKVISGSGLKIGADALGGAAAPFWEPIAAKYKLNLESINTSLDPQFSFMSVDKDGKIRMDCSSPWAMASLIEHAGKYDLAFGNDPDSDRHGIVTPSGLMNPNHYLAVAVDYLYHNRPGWRPDAAIGKTLVTSSMLDRVAKAMERNIYEVPVGFKWFVEPLISGACAFGGEESAGASFLRFDATPWSTDKDGIILNLLAAEITAVTSKTPDILYKELSAKHGDSYYERIDAPANARQKDILKNLNPENVKTKSLAGEPITNIFTKAPGNNAPIDGLKVCTSNGWFAARPSGTEEIYKIYAESFVSEKHLLTLLNEAKQLVNNTFSGLA